MKTSSIKARLSTGLLLLVAFFLIQAGVTWFYVQQAQSKVVHTSTHHALVAQELGDLAVRAQQLRRFEKEYFVYVGVSEKRTAYEKEWNDAFTQMSQALKTVQANKNLAYSADDLKQITVWGAAADFYAAEMRKVFATSQAQANLVAESLKTVAVAINKKNKADLEKIEAVPQMLAPTEVNDMIKAGKDRFSNDLIKGIDKMTKAKVADALTIANQAGQIFNNLLIVILATVVVGIVVALILLFVLPATIAKPIAALANEVDQMSRGKLDQKITNHNVKEFTLLETALERLRVAQHMLAQRLRAAN